MDKSERSWMLVAIALFFGSPTVAGLVFGLTNDIPTAIALAVFYAAVVVVWEFTSKVSQRLQDKAAERAADRLWEGAERWWAGYGRRYRQYLIDRHQYFDVKGLSMDGPHNLDLRQVFVELSLAPKAFHKAQVDPLEVPEELSQGRHAIWRYLRAKQMVGQDLVIIGPPGSGKTTLLKHMVLALVGNWWQRRQWQVPKRLPILLFLRNHAAAIQEQEGYALPMAIRDNLKRWGPEPPAGWFEKQLAKGRCLICLDGLDEVAETGARQKVVEWVEQQMVTYGQNRFVVTSRPFGYRSNPLAGVTVLEIRPFTSQQMARFVQNWYLANEIMGSQKNDRSVQILAQEGAEDLLKRIRQTQTLNQLAVNPLLLTMIATVHRYHSSLPGRRVELYTQICEAFLGKRQQAIGVLQRYTPAQKQHVLQPLAFHMMVQEQREIPLVEALAVIRKPLASVDDKVEGAAFLKMIEDSSALLLEREQGVYGFAHLTFQEYLAAVHVQESGIEDALLEHVAESWWQETIRLYAARAEATRVIEACLAEEKPAIAALLLAVACNEEARAVAPAVRARLEALLVAGLEAEDEEQRRLAAEVRLARRLEGFVAVNEETWVDSGWVTQAEYQLFLDEERTKGLEYRPFHWAQGRFAPGQGQVPVVGIASADAAAFCTWLNARTWDEKWVYRLPRVGELAGYGMAIVGVVAPILGYWVVGENGYECEMAVGEPPRFAREQLFTQLNLLFNQMLSLALAIDPSLTIDPLLSYRNPVYNYNLDYLSINLRKIAERNSFLVYLAIVSNELAQASDLASHRLLRTVGSANPVNISALALDLSSDFARARNKAVTAPNLARALDHASTSALEIAVTSDPVSNVGLALSIIHKVTYEYSRVGSSERRFNSDINHLCLYTYYLAWALLPNILTTSDRAALSYPSVREAIRSLHAFLYIVTKQKTMPKQHKFWQLLRRFTIRGGNVLLAAENDIVVGYLDMLVDWVFLEERVAGRLPTYEGIRLVKARQEDYSKIPYRAGRGWYV